MKMTRKTMVLLTVIAGCDVPEDGEPAWDEHGVEEGVAHQALVADPRPQTADVCVNDSRVGESFVDAVRGSFTFRYFAGTPAARDLENIAGYRMSAYERAREFYGTYARPQVTVELFPSRMAAV